MQHNYNSSGICTCLEFRPVPETAKLIDNLGLLWRKTVDGIELIHDQQRREALDLQAGSEPVSFDFKVFASDPHFKSYSEPYTGAEIELLYFDNRAADGPGAHELSATGTASQQDLIDANAAEVEDLLTMRDRLTPPVFVLRLFGGERGEHLKRWLDGGTQVYTIRFTSRKRYWKYYLLGATVSGKAAQNEYRVVDPDKQIEFEATGEEALADRRMARTFRSKQPIPLNEYYSYRFQLQQQGRNGEAIVIPGLPHPGLGQVGTDTVAQQPATVAEIYINSK